MKIFGWILCILASLLAGWVLFDTIITSENAQQQGSGAALACAIVVIPYVLARALEKLIGK